MHNCKQCNNEFETLDKLRRHSSRVHKINSQEIYNIYVLNNNIPTCKCGCGETPNFITFTYGYNEWIRGHISRIHNNWGHNQTAIDNSSKTRREQFANGSRKVWNDGLTKETDIRVARYGINGSNSINSNSNEIARRKLQMSKQWKSGKIVAEYGVKSHNWKGGTSSINNIIRANQRLYTEWIYPILIEQRFTCQDCGFRKQLEVHHDKEQMSDILKEFVDKTKEYTFDEKRVIANKVIDYHVDNNISGKTLCKSCHMNLHPSYNI